LASVLARLADLAKRGRKVRRSQALLDNFSDHLLADIGLRRDRIGPEVENYDLLPRSGSSGSARINRF
jgi:uncharacterized protein YjiS (DUF1127 family)